MAKQNLTENHQCCSSSRDLNWGPTTDGIEQRKKVQHPEEINHWPFCQEAFAQPWATTSAQRHGEFLQQVLEMLFAFIPNSKKSSPTSIQRFFEWLESVLVATDHHWASSPLTASLNRSRAKSRSELSRKSIAVGNFPGKDPFRSKPFFSAKVSQQFFNNVWRRLRSFDGISFDVGERKISSRSFERLLQWRWKREEDEYWWKMGPPMTRRGLWKTGQTFLCSPTPTKGGWSLEKAKSTCLQFGGWHSTEVAFALLTQQPRVRFSALPSRDLSSITACSQWTVAIKWTHLVQSRSPQIQSVL